MKNSFCVFTSRFLLTAGVVLLPFALWADEPIKVAQAEAVRQAITKPQPEYPPLARQLKLQGNVVVEASITEDGSVDAVKIVNGNPLFTAAAVAVMKRWKFQPFAESGKPVRAVATMSFTFRM